MKKAIFLSILCLVVFGSIKITQASETDLVISEIMYDLSGSDSNREWIEIYNSGTEEIAVIPGSGGQAWRFFDGSNHTLSLAQGTTTIASFEFFVIASNAEQFLLDYPEFVGTVFDTVMSLPNSSADIALSFDGGDNYPIAASYDSTWGGNGTGLSLEKINLTQDSGPDNWQESSITGGTPGATNSEGQPEEETQNPQAVAICPTSLLVGEEGFFDATQSIDPQNLSLIFLWDFLDGTTTTSSQAYHTWLEVNNYNVSLTVSNGELDDTVYCLVEIVNEEEEEVEEEEDDGGGGDAPPPPPSHWDDILVSEFLPNPEGSDDQEWIELYNAGIQTVDLIGFKLQDNSARVFTLDEDLNLDLSLTSGEFLVLEKNVTRISLNNTGGDAVKLYDPDENLLEIIEYSDTAQEGKSYARQGNNFLWTIEPTPGAANIFVANQPPQANISLQSDDLVVDQEVILSGKNSTDPEEGNLEYVWDFGDETSGDEKTENHIYHAAGTYLVKLIVTDSEGASDEDNLVINISGPELKVGIQDLQPINFALDELIISEFIPNPVGSDDYEWIELQNRADQKIDLLGWYLDDQEGGSRPYVFATSTVILSGDFLVVSRELSGLTLNNSEDSIRLLTPLQEVWQEVAYNKIPEGQTMAWDDLNNEWFISTEPTPGVFNYAAISTQMIFSPSQLDDLDIKQNIILQGLAIHEASSSTRSLYLVDWDQEEIYYDQMVEIYFYQKDFPSIKKGDLVEVSGQISKLGELPRIKIKNQSDIIVGELNLELAWPEIITPDDLIEEALGDFVAVRGLVTKKSGKNIYLASNTEEDWQVRVYTNFATKDLEIKKGTEIIVAGILSVTDSGFKLVPFNVADLLVSTTVEAAAFLEEDNQEISSDVNLVDNNGRKQDIKNILFFIIIGLSIAGAVYFLKKKFAK